MFDSLNFFKKKKTSQLGVELDHLSNLYLNPLSSQKIKKAVRREYKGFDGVSARKGGLIRGIPKLATKGF